MNPVSPYQYICIEGNIGAGKTTLCELLAGTYNCKLVLEQFAENPFLPYFYDDPARYALPLELFFMTERHKQLEKHLLHPDLFHEFVVSDYTFVKTLLFAKNNLKRDEYRLFQRMFFVLNAAFPRPDILVYLHRSTPKLIENIRNRGREYEQDIKEPYLKDLQDAYFEYFKGESSFPIVIIDVDKLDFVNNPKHFQEIKLLIMQTYQPGVHRISLVN